MLLLPKRLLVLTHITSFRFMLMELFILEQFLEGKKKKELFLCQCFLSKIF